MSRELCTYLVVIGNCNYGPGGWPRTVGHELKFESPGGNDAGSSFSASRRDATRRMSATELVCAAPSQQRLRRSSDSVAAPSQQRCAQHQIYS